MKLKVIKAGLIFYIIAILALFIPTFTGWIRPEFKDHYRSCLDMILDNWYCILVFFMSGGWGVLFSLKEKKDIKITLATLDTFTEQEVFEYVSKHLIKQNRKSFSIIGSTGVKNCVYRSSKGDKCAAGCLMSDEEYDQSMENKVWSILVSDGLITDKHKDLILELQKIHDFSLPEHWRIRLIELGNKFNLDTKFLNND